MNSWLDEITRQLRGVAAAFWRETRVQDLMPLLRPVPPFNQPGFLAPAVTIGGLLSFLLLSGVAVTALGALLLALLSMYLLIVQVFGVTIELAPFGVR